MLAFLDLLGPLRDIVGQGTGWLPFQVVPTSTPSPTPLPKLSTNIYEISGYWNRDASTNLPTYIMTLGYAVYNAGTAQAENVTVELKSAEDTLNKLIIPTLNPSSKYSNSITVNVTYDSQRNVEVYATCPQSSDSSSLLAQATLPRSFSADNADMHKLFVTPNEVVVADLEDQIVKDKFILSPNWIALRDWVGDNIDYKNDSSVHDKQDYWQLPKETLTLRSGDCEDFSVLLCSLLRANGWSENDAYVVIGKNSANQYHAWVKIHLDVLGWYNIEPQGDGWCTLIGDFVNLSGYSAEAYFNDQQYHEV